MGGVAANGGAARDGDGMEARALSSLVDALLPRAWRQESTIHGEEHWRCVAATGIALAPSVGWVDRTLVFCFGLLHDTRRMSDSVEPEHGARAASFAQELRDEGVLPLDDVRFALLAEALTYHSHSSSLISANPTIGTCWDADRLHLPRVSIRPRPELLSTPAARAAAALAAAALLRSDGPPSWATLVSLAATG
jgi:uncharacterized protein